MSEPESGKILKSVVSLEASKIDDHGAPVEAMISVERSDEPDPDLKMQILLVTPGELRDLYDKMRLYHEQGIWSFGTVER